VCPAGSYCKTAATVEPCNAEGAYCPAGSATQGACPAGKYCPDSVTSLPCDLGTYCPAGSANATQCAAGSYCATPATQIPCVTAGAYCPAESTSEGVCPAGSYCKTAATVEPCNAEGAYCPVGSYAAADCPAGSYCANSTVAVECASGSYCPKGSHVEAPCLAGSFCETPSTQVQCPEGFYCLAGVTAPTECPAAADCPAGYSKEPVDPSNPPLTAAMTLDMEADVFLAEYQDEFKAGIASWLGGDVSVDNVTITCVCSSSCSISGGTTPEGESCGTGSGARHNRLLLQTPVAPSTEAEFDVAVADAGDRLAMEEFANDKSNVGGLQVSLAASGMPADAASSVSVDVVEQNVVAADVNLSFDGIEAPDYGDIILTVMVAVPLALLVVGVAIYQNTKKPKPVPIAGLMFSITFAFYDFFSDVWFAVMPTPDPQYQYFTWIAGGVVGVALIVGAYGVYYAMTNHELIAPAPGMVEYVLAVAAATNLELLSLMPWVNDSVGGLPSATVAAMPTASVVVEDLPQLLVQGAYLLVSGDTGNLVVLISVGMSACSLLLRFTRSAMSAAGLAAVHSESESDDDSSGTSSDDEAGLPERVEAREARRKARADKVAQSKKDNEESTATIAVANVFGF